MAPNGVSSHLMQLNHHFFIAWTAATSLLAQSPPKDIVEPLFNQPHITAKDVGASVIGEVHPDSGRF
jgi:hypothetical protein